MSDDGHSSRIFGLNIMFPLYILFDLAIWHLHL